MKRLQPSGPVNTTEDTPPGHHSVHHKQVHNNNNQNNGRPLVPAKDFDWLILSRDFLMGFEQFATLYYLYFFYSLQIIILIKLLCSKMVSLNIVSAK